MGSPAERRRCFAVIPVLRCRKPFGSTGALPCRKLAGNIGAALCFQLCRNNRRGGTPSFTAKAKASYDMFQGR